MTGTPINKPYLQKLGKDGVAWVRESLGHTAGFDGKVTFSQDVLSKTNLGEGEVYIAVAAAEHHDAVINNRLLKHGKLPLGSHNMNMQAGLLLTKLKQVANEHGPISIVNEDFMPNPNGPIEKYSASEVYCLYKQYLYIKELSEIETESELIDHLCHDFLLSAYIVPTKDVPNGNTLTKNDSEKLANSVIGIINYAYDGETFTLWLSDSLVVKGN